MNAVTDLFAYERERRSAVSKAPYLICGVDEVGRGPVAGPLMAAAVILRENAAFPGLNDSKKLTERQRTTLFLLIIEKAEAYCVAQATVEEIETLGIGGANKLAMRRAVEGLLVDPDLILVDGCVDPGVPLPTECIVGGDGTCACIAAASILAKVTRDRLMCGLAELYPAYGLEKHKGYCWAFHERMILEHGLTPIHRKSFLTRVLSGRTRMTGT